jgi:phosphopantetheine--protein transferase-like protein
MARLLHESDAAADAGNLKDLLPGGVWVMVAEPRHANAELHPLEQEFLDARHMQPARGREFRIGRALAREALARLGVKNHPLLPAETREPQWPDGIVGSITHCEGVGAVAVAESARFCGLGIDLERIDRIDESIADTVCTPDERSELEAMAPSARRRHLSLLFSAKESVFKALFPPTRQFLDFHDVSLILGEGHFSARSTITKLKRIEAVRGRFFAGSHLVATAAWLPAD